MMMNQGKTLQKLIESPKLNPKLDHLIVSCHGADKVGLLHQFAVACHSHDASIRCVREHSGDYGCNNDTQSILII